MEVIYTKHEGYQATMPLEIDTESSKSLVYLRKNIQRVTKTDMDGHKVECWQYDEATLTPEQFETYKSEAALMVLKNNDSIVESMRASEDERFTIMNAIADLYSLLLDAQTGEVE